MNTKKKDCAIKENLQQVLLLVAQSCLAFCDPVACQASLSFPVSCSFLKLMSMGSVMPSNHLILCCPLHLPASIFPSIRVFSNKSVLRIWFPLGLTGLISFQSKGLSRVVFSNHNSKASILWCLAFYMVQLSHPYMTAGKTIALTILCRLYFWPYFDYTLSAKWHLCF